jgi:hypothetical protein
MTHALLEVRDQPEGYKVATTSAHARRAQLHFATPAFLDFFWFSTLQEQLDHFAQVPSRFLDRITLTGNIQLGTQGHETGLFPFNDRGEMH